jgi:DNA-directed RNA polymerase specialized sigma24 family protein
LAVRIYLTRERLAMDTRLPVAPYLRTMARNLAAGELSRRQRKWRRELTSGVERHGDAHEAVPAAVLRDIEVAFARLSEVEQSYLLLCKEHGMGALSHGEIATRLGTSPQYISQVSKRALTRLRKQLRGQGYRIDIDGKTDRE